VSNSAVSAPVPGGGGRVGVFVGLFEGDTDGDAVVGLEDGDEDGLDVGDFVGLAVVGDAVPSTDTVMSA